MLNKRLSKSMIVDNDSRHQEVVVQFLNGMEGFITSFNKTVSNLKSL